jgi:NAD(P)-dependent dehydrogenase (short-subunit alcohol dehydrogenase family)
MADSSILPGRVAVVTGSGRGIGEGIARSLAGAGAAVVLGARSADEIEAVASSIIACGGRALAVTTDVTDRFALGSLATAAVDEFGHLDIWVNNAGGTTASKPLAELTLREWNECLALNLTAVWDGAMAAAEQMQWGSIVNISSVAAFGPVRGAGHYSACKAAVNSLTQTMAHELAPDIRVNGIAPGPVPTEHFFGNIEAKDYPLDRLTERIPLGLGTPRDIGDAAVYLSSDAARWVTGQTLVVSGGLTSF